MSCLTGTGQLIKLILRRDRVMLPVWIAFLAIIPVSFVSAISGLYPTEAARLELVNTAGMSPVFVAFYGPLVSTNLGAIVAWRAGIVPVIVAIMSMITIIRHTRAEEDAGRSELLGSAVIGRRAGLAAALIVTTGANLMLAVLVSAGMISQKLEVIGSITLGLQYAAVGIVFGTIGLAAAQLASRAGAARALAFSVVGATFLLRIAADVSSFTWLSWLSPLGWAERIRPYGEERWWIFAPLAALAVGLSVISARLFSMRDIGSGLLPSRPGPGKAAPGFNNPTALAWRLQRNLLIGWAAGFAVLGAALGGIASSLTDLLKDSPQMQIIIARLGGSAGIVDAYFAGIMGLFALIATGYGIQAALRMRGEETEQHAEPVLATSVSRLRWASSHLLFALAGPVLVLAIMGLSAGLVHGIQAHDVAGQLPRIFGGALVQLPAVWVTAGIAIALFGLLPRWTGIGWLALGAFVLLGQLGSVLQLPNWALDISPFTHIPKIPGGELAAGPLILLIAAAALLSAAGLIGLKRRDLGAL